MEQVNEPLWNTAAVPLQVALAIPERASVAVPLTDRVEELETELLAGEAMFMTGGVLSRLMVAVALALFLATSVAVPLITWLAPSLLTT
jgi:hypothetical protein